MCRLLMITFTKQFECVKCQYRNWKTHSSPARSLFLRIRICQRAYSYMGEQHCHLLSLIHFLNVCTSDTNWLCEQSTMIRHLVTAVLDFISICFVWFSMPERHGNRDICGSISERERYASNRWVLTCLKRTVVVSCLFDSLF